jgi:hypothetical protein
VSEEVIWGYQRVADGGACEFCLLLDGAQFRTDDPMPIHNNCGCGVEPVEYTRGQSRRVEAPESSVQSAPESSALPDEVINAVEATDEAQRTVASAAQDLNEAILMSEKPKSLVFQSLDPGTGGQMTRSGALFITTSNSVPTSALRSVYHHEFGHFLDYSKTAASAGRAAEVLSARKELLRVLRRTGAVKELREIKGLVRGAGAKRYATYLLSEDELIARAFAAWIARKNPAIKKSMDTLFDLYGSDALNKRLAAACKFENDDFGPIDTAIRKWLVAKGFL